MTFEKTKTKKLIYFFVFFSIFSSAFLFDVHHADAWSLFGWIEDTTSAAFFYVINVVLYAVFVLVTYPVTWASMLFGLTVDPVAVDTTFNLPVVYTLWQMVRDFFNLFFILTLLFIAFATIFQISSYNYKSTLGKLLLMALLVNFSFPISRFIIDAANVPMYFFMESMFTDSTKAKAKDVASVAFSTSNIESAILGENISGVGDIKGDSNVTTRLLVGIIFMFLFGVSLLVLALLFLVRSLMLVILIIFSSVGFAGMVIPGFRQYASKWWDNLLKYAFFGPAAMLMMLVSIKFLAGFSGPGGIASPSAIAGQSTNTGGGTYLASMVSVMAPLILIWMSIAIGQTMGVAGAGAVTSRAQTFSKWAGRKGARAGFAVGTFGLGPAGVTRAKEFGKGAQDGWKNFAKTGKLFGADTTKIPYGVGKLVKSSTGNAAEEREAKWSSRFKYGSGDGAMRYIQEKRIAEAKKEYKDSGASVSTVAKDLGEGDKGDPIQRMAAAQLMAENKWIQTADHLEKVLGAVASFNIDSRDTPDAKDANKEYQQGEAAKVIGNVDDKVIKSLTTEQLSGIFNSDANKQFFKQQVLETDANGRPVDGKVVYEYDPDKKTDLHKALEGRLAKANKLDVSVKFEADQLMRSGKVENAAEATAQAYKNILKSQSRESIAQSGNLFTGSDKEAFFTYLDGKQNARQYMQKLMASDKMNDGSREALSEHMNARAVEVDDARGADERQQNDDMRRFV